jgi:uncharacterized protein (TIGR02466 family)
MVSLAAFRDARVLRMFPTFLWRAELAPEVCAPINERIARTLREIGAPLGDLKPGESWQSNHGLHRCEPFLGLIDHIMAAADAVLGHLRIAGARCAITGCWANLSAPGARHGTHSHPNNYLSGVYYVHTQDGADTINFHDPRPQVAIMRPPVDELTAENTDQVVVKVKPGTLLLFPAWLLHSVDANRSDGVRVSLAFNLMFASYAKTMGKPLWEGGRRAST